MRGQYNTLRIIWSVKILSLHATKSAFVAMNDKYMIVSWGHTTVGGKMPSYAFEKENGWAGESSASTITRPFSPTHILYS